MRVYKKAILPSGFRANAVSCGIKRSGKPDLALFYSEIPAKAACVFTANKLQAAPIKVNKRHLKASKSFRAILVNSGNANAFTGDAGIMDAGSTIRSLAVKLAIKKEKVLLSSTGIIGRRLEVAKIKKALPALINGLSRQGIDKAKKAIMTTDTFVKEASVAFSIGKEKLTICGIAKGAGMIAPNMVYPERGRGATMLAFIFTDANITPGALSRALKAAVGGSFNCITVDACMSTNDSVMMLANAAAGNNPIKDGKNFDLFCNALQIVCLELAKLIVRDAEGATKFIKIRVSRAKTFAEAKKAAKAIANSNLFKTAMYGEDPNLGRIAAAVGASGIDIKEGGLKIKLGPLNRKDINIEVALGSGKCCATVYTSDLTPGYIKINAEYN